MNKEEEDNVVQLFPPLEVESREGAWFTTGWIKVDNEPFTLEQDDDT